VQNGKKAHKTGIPEKEEKTKPAAIQSQDKHTGMRISLFWAHFLRPPAVPGMRRKKPGYPLQFLSLKFGAWHQISGLRYFRFYPLRCRKTTSISFFDFDFLLRKKS
jgi:hypothetical protein